MIVFGLIIVKKIYNKNICIHTYIGVIYIAIYILHISYSAMHVLSSEFSLMTLINYYSFFENIAIVYMHNQLLDCKALIAI